MGGGSLSAIVQDIRGGLAVLVLSKKSEELDLKATIIRSERRSRQMEAADSIPVQCLSKKVATNSNLKTDTSVQIWDQRYASTYQLAHCSYMPTSPEVHSREPARRQETGRNRGNFEVRSYSRSRTMENSPRGCSPSTRQTTAWRERVLKGSRHTKSLRNLTDSRDSNICIKESSKTINLNRWKQEETEERNRKYVVMPAKTKHKAFKSSGSRSPGPSCSRNNRARETIDTLSNSIPRPPDTASGDRHAARDNMRDTLRAVYGTVKGPMASYNICPRMWDRLDKHRREFHDSKPSNSGGSPRPSLRLKGQKSTDSCITCKRGILSKTLSKLKIETEKVICECEDTMQQRQGREKKKEDQKVTCECRTGPSSGPCKWFAGACCSCGATVCDCVVDKHICECLVPVEEKTSSPASCECMKYVKKGLETVIEEWLSELPIQSKEKPKDKATRDNIIKNLIKNLAAMNDDTFNKEGLNEIKKQVHGMPMWLPKDKDGKDGFIDAICNDLFGRVKAFRDGKSRTAKGSQLDELYDELANEILIIPKEGIQPAGVMTDEMRKIHEQLVMDALNEVPEFNNVSEDKKKKAAKDLIHKLSDSLVQNSDDEKVEKIESVMRFFIARNWLVPLLRQNDIKMDPATQRQLIKKIVDSTKTAQSIFLGQSPDTIRGGPGLRQQISNKTPNSRQTQDSTKKSSSGKKLGDVIGEWLNELPTQANEKPEDKATRDKHIQNLTETLAAMDDDAFNKDGLNEIKKRIREMPIWLPKDKDNKERFIDEISNDLFNRNKAYRDGKSRTAKGSQLDELSDELANEMLKIPKEGIQPVGVMTDELRNIHEQLVLDALNKVPEFNKVSENIKRTAAKDLIHKLSDFIVQNSDDGNIAKIDSVLRSFIVRNWLAPLLRNNNINLDPEKQRQLIQSIVASSNAEQVKIPGQSLNPKGSSQFPKKSRNGPSVATGHSTTQVSDGTPSSQNLRKQAPKIRGMADQSQNTQQPPTRVPPHYLSAMKPGKPLVSHYSPRTRPEHDTSIFIRKIPNPGQHSYQDPYQYPSEIRPDTEDTSQYSPEMRPDTEEQRQYTPEIRPGNLDPNQYPIQKRPGNYVQDSPLISSGTQDQIQDSPEIPPGGNLDPNQYTYYQGPVPYTSETQSSYKDPRLYSSTPEPGNLDPNQYPSEIKRGTQDPSQYSPEIRPGTVDPSQYSPEMRPDTQEKRQYSPEMRPDTQEQRQYSPEMGHIQKKPDTHVQDSPLISSGAQDQIQDSPEIRPGNLDPSKYSYYQGPVPYSSKTQPSYKDPRLYSPALIPGHLDPSQYPAEMRLGAQDARKYSSQNKPYKDQRQYPPEMRPGNLDSKQYPPQKNLGDPRQRSPATRPGYSDPRQYFSETPSSSQDPRQYSPAMHFPADMRPESQYPGHASDVRSDSRAGSPDRQRPQDMNSSKPGYKKIPSSTNVQYRDKNIMPNLENYTSGGQRIPSESEYKKTLDNILNKQGNSKPSALMDLLTLLEQLHNAGIQSGNFHDDLIDRINELSEDLANDHSLEYPYDGRPGAAPEKRGTSKTQKRFNTDEKEDTSRNRKADEKRAGTSPTKDARRPFAFKDKNIDRPKSPMRATDKRSVSPGPNKSIQSSRTSSPRRTADGRKKSVSPGRGVKRAGSPSRGRLERQTGTASQRERTMSPSKTTDERRNLSGKGMTPSSVRYDNNMRSRSSGTDSNIQRKGADKAYNKESENISGKAKGKNEYNYLKEVHNNIQRWIDDLGIDLKGNEQNLARGLADEILDKQKYLQINPSAKTSDDEELEDMRYQIYKMLNKKVDPDTIRLIMPRVAALMGGIKKIPVPDLSLPADPPYMRLGDPQSSTDQDPRPYLSETRHGHRDSNQSPGTDYLPEKSPANQDSIPSYGTDDSSDLRSKIEPDQKSEANEIDEEAYTQELRSIIMDWLNDLDADLEGNEEGFVNDLANEIIDRQKYLQQYPNETRSDEEEIMKYKIYKTLGDKVDPGTLEIMMLDVYDLMDSINEVPIPRYAAPDIISSGDTQDTSDMSGSHPVLSFDSQSAGEPSTEMGHAHQDPIRPGTQNLNQYSPKVTPGSLDPSQHSPEVGIGTPDPRPGPEPSSGPGSQNTTKIRTGTQEQRQYSPEIIPDNQDGSQHFPEIKLGQDRTQYSEIGPDNQETLQCFPEMRPDNLVPSQSTAELRPGEQEPRQYSREMRHANQDPRKYSSKMTPLNLNPVRQYSSEKRSDNLDTSQYPTEIRPDTKDTSPYPPAIRPSDQNPSQLPPKMRIRTQDPGKRSSKKSSGYLDTNEYPSEIRPDNLDPSQFPPAMSPGNLDSSQYPPEMRIGTQDARQHSSKRSGNLDTSQYPSEIRPDAANATQHPLEIRPSDQDLSRISPEMRIGIQDPKNYSSKKSPGNLDPTEYPSEIRPDTGDTKQYPPEIKPGDQDTNQYSPEMRNYTQESRQYYSKKAPGNLSPGSQHPLEMTPGDQAFPQFLPKIRSGNLDPSQYPREMRIGVKDPRQYSSSTRPGNLDPSQYPSEIRPYTQDSSKYPTISSGEQGQSQYSPEMIIGTQDSLQLSSRKNRDPSQYLSYIRPDTEDPTQFSPKMRPGDQIPSQYPYAIRPDTQDTSKYPPEIRTRDQDLSQHSPVIKIGAQDSEQYNSKKRSGNLDPSQYISEIRPDTQDTSQYTPGIRSGDQDPSQYSPEMIISTQDPRQYSFKKRSANLGPSPYTSELRPDTKDTSQYSRGIRPGDQEPSQYSQEMRNDTQESRQYYSKKVPGNLDPSQYPSEIRPDNQDPSQYPSEMRIGTQGRSQYSSKKSSGLLDPSETRSDTQDASDNPPELRPGDQDPSLYSPEMRITTQFPQQYSSKKRSGNLGPSQYPSEIRPDTKDTSQNYREIKAADQEPSQYPPDIRIGNQDSRHYYSKKGSANLDPSQYPLEIRPGDQDPSQYSPEMRFGTQYPGQYSSKNSSGTLHPRQYPSEIRPETEYTNQYPSEIRSGNQDSSRYPSDMKDMIGFKKTSGYMDPSQSSEIRPNTQDSSQYSPELRIGTQDPRQYSAEKRYGNINPSQYPSEIMPDDQDAGQYPPKIGLGHLAPSQYPSEMKNNIVGSKSRSGNLDPSQLHYKMRPDTQVTGQDPPEIRLGELNSSQYPSEMPIDTRDPKQHSTKKITSNLDTRQYPPEMIPNDQDPSKYSSKMKLGNQDPGQYSFKKGTDFDPNQYPSDTQVTSQNPPVIRFGDINPSQYSPEKRIDTQGPGKDKSKKTVILVPTKYPPESSVGHVPSQFPLEVTSGVLKPGQYLPEMRAGVLKPSQYSPEKRPGDLDPSQYPPEMRPAVLIPGQNPSEMRPRDQDPSQYSSLIRPATRDPSKYSPKIRPGDLDLGQYPPETRIGTQDPRQYSSKMRSGKIVPIEHPFEMRPGVLEPGQYPPEMRPGDLDPNRFSPGMRIGTPDPRQYYSKTNSINIDHSQYPSKVRAATQDPSQYSSQVRSGVLDPGQYPPETRIGTEDSSQYSSKMRSGRLDPSQHLFGMRPGVLEPGQYPPEMRPGNLDPSQYPPETRSGVQNPNQFTQEPGVPEPGQYPPEMRSSDLEHSQYRPKMRPGLLEPGQYSAETKIGTQDPRQYSSKMGSGMLDPRQHPFEIRQGDLQPDQYPPEMRSGDLVSSQYRPKIRPGILEAGQYPPEMRIGTQGPRQYSSNMRSGRLDPSQHPCEMRLGDLDPSQYPLEMRPGILDGHYPPKITPADLVSSHYPPEMKPGFIKPGQYPPEMKLGNVDPSHYPPEIRTGVLKAGQFPPQMRIGNVDPSQYSPEIRPDDQDYSHYGLEMTPGVLKPGQYPPEMRLGDLNLSQYPPEMKLGDLFPNYYPSEMTTGVLKPGPYSPEMRLGNLDPIHYPPEIRPGVMMPGQYPPEMKHGNVDPSHYPPEIRTGVLKAGQFPPEMRIGNVDPSQYSPEIRPDDQDYSHYDLEMTPGVLKPGQHPPEMRLGDPNLSQYPPEMKLGDLYTSNYPPEMRPGVLKPGQYPPKMRLGDLDLSQYPPEMKLGDLYTSNYPPEMRPGVLKPGQYPPKMRLGDLDLSQYPPEMKLGDLYTSNYPPEMRPGVLKPGQYPPKMKLGDLYTGNYPPEMRPGVLKPGQYPPKMRLGDLDLSQYPPEMKLGDLYTSNYPPEMRPGVLKPGQYPPKMRLGDLDLSQYPPEIRPESQDTSQYQDSSKYSPVVRHDILDPRQYTFITRPGFQDPREETVPGNNLYSDMRSGSQNPEYPSDVGPSSKAGLADHQQRRDLGPSSPVDLTQYSPEINQDNLDESDSKYPEYSQITPDSPGDQDPKQSTGMNKTSHMIPTSGNSGYPSDMGPGRMMGLPGHQKQSDIRPRSPINPDSIKVSEDHPSHKTFTQGQTSDDEVFKNSTEIMTQELEPNPKRESSLSSFADDLGNVSVVENNATNDRADEINPAELEFQNALDEILRRKNSRTPSILLDLIALLKQVKASDSSMFKFSNKLLSHIKKLSVDLANEQNTDFLSSRPLPTSTPLKGARYRKDIGKDGRISPSRGRNADERSPEGMVGRDKSSTERRGLTSQYPPKMRPGDLDPFQYPPEMRPGVLKPSQYPSEMSPGVLKPGQYPPEMRPSVLNPGQYCPEMRPGFLKPGQCPPEMRFGDQGPSQYPPEMRPGGQDPSHYPPEMRQGFLKPGQYPPESRFGDLDPSHYPPELRQGFQKPGQYPPESRFGDLDPSHYPPELRQGFLKPGQYPPESRFGDLDPSHYPPELRQGFLKPGQYRPESRFGDLDHSHYPPEMRPSVLNLGQYPPEMRPDILKSDQYSPEARPGSQGPSQYHPEMRPGVLKPGRYSPKIRPNTQDPSQYPPEVRPGDQDPSQDPPEFGIGTQDPRKYSSKKRSGILDPNHYPFKKRRSNLGHSQYPPEIRPETQDTSQYQDPTKYSSAVRPDNLDPRPYTSETRPGFHDSREETAPSMNLDSDMRSGSQYPGYPSDVGPSSKAGLADHQQRRDVRPSSPLNITQYPPKVNLDNVDESGRKYPEYTHIRPHSPGDQDPRQSTGMIKTSHMIPTSLNSGYPSDMGPGRIVGLPGHQQQSDIRPRSPINPDSIKVSKDHPSHKTLTQGPTSDDEVLKNSTEIMTQELDPNPKRESGLSNFADDLGKVSAVQKIATKARAGEINPAELEFQNALDEILRRKDSRTPSILPDLIALLKQVKASDNSMFKFIHKLLSHIKKLSIDLANEQNTDFLSGRPLATSTPLKRVRDRKDISKDERISPSRGRNADQRSPDGTLARNAKRPNLGVDKSSAERTGLTSRGRTLIPKGRIDSPWVNKGTKKSNVTLGLDKKGTKRPSYNTDTLANGADEKRSRKELSKNASNAKMKNKQNYCNQLQNKLQDWINGLGVDLKGNDNEFIKALANDIADRQKYLQLNPNVTTSNEEGRLKRQIINRLTKKVEPAALKTMISNVYKLIESLNEVPVPRLAEPAERDSKAKANVSLSTDSIIQKWCDNLALPYTTKAEAGAIRQDIYGKIKAQIYELDMDPETANDSSLYEDALSDYIEELLNVLPIDPHNIDRIEPILFDQENDANSLAKDYKQQLRDTISSISPKIDNPTDDEQATFEAFKDDLADAFINLHYVGGDEALNKKFKDKIKDKINQFADEYLKSDPTKPLSTAQLENDLYNALRSVEMPNDESMRSEVELSRKKDLVEDWANELPLKELTPREKIEMKKILSHLAKRLHELEKENMIYDDIHEDNIRREIEKHLHELPLRSRSNLNGMIDKLVDEIKHSEHSSTFNEGSRHLVVKGKHGIPPSYLTREEKEHVQRIKNRAHSSKKANDLSSRPPWVTPHASSTFHRPLIDRASQTDVADRNSMYGQQYNGNYKIPLGRRWQCVPPPASGCQVPRCCKGCTLHNYHLKDCPLLLNTPKDRSSLLTLSSSFLIPSGRHSPLDTCSRTPSPCTLKRRLLDQDECENVNAFKPLIESRHRTLNCATCARDDRLFSRPTRSWCRSHPRIYRDREEISSPYTIERKPSNWTYTYGGKITTGKTLRPDLEKFCPNCCGIKCPHPSSFYFR